jgi:hypothetical protein
MKFIIAGILFTVLSTSSSFTKSTPKKEKHIDYTFTSNEGCTVHIVGDVSYSLLPPKITGFTGTVTLGGPKNCPKGTLTFGNTSKSLTVRFDSESVCTVSNMIWEGKNESFLSALNDARLVKGLVAEINRLCE